MLITFEGGEGSGKSSLVRRAADFISLRGIRVVTAREPGRTVLGERIRDLVLKVMPETKICAKAELMLYLASRAQIVEELISPALDEGAVVLCDRFNDSTIVYQGYARGLDMEVVKLLCGFVCGSVRPDLTFYLDVDPKLGLIRTKRTAKEQSVADETDRIESEGEAFHDTVRQGYLLLAENEPDRIVVLDSNKPLEDVWVQAVKVLEKCLSV